MITNRYFWATLLFLLLLLLSRNNGLYRHFVQRRTIEKLKEQKRYYQDEIHKTQKAIKALRYDTAQLEKYAREKYFMKKDNEDIFVVIREKEGK